MDASRPLIRTSFAVLVAVAFCIPHGAPLRGESPVRYRFSFPEPQHRWMEVEAAFPDVGSGTLELRMSRSSPGRYSLHDFAKNVYDVRVVGADGREIQPTRPDPYGWNVAGHGGRVTVRYKVYGDRIDGTYLAVDETHAHINMPAAIMWAHGLDDRPATLTFEPPAASGWQVATQLHASASPLEFTAPNLQYLMDSPAEFGPISVRQFSVGDRTFRFSLHHTGTDAELDGYVKDVEKIVRQEGAIFGEYPQYEPGSYTFLADYLPWASGDGMEHRNSTVMTSSGSIATSRMVLLDTVAHEFFHCWNVERIRPSGLEPFDFDRANLSDSLWLAEGFTQYYGPLVMQRAQLVDVAATAGIVGGLVDTVVNDPGRAVRSAVEMSRMAPFIDGGRTVDRTNWANTVLSYYPFGGAIALALDLSLRDRSDGRVSLDDFMRAMWQRFGRPGGAREGYVDRPYSLADAEETLAGVSGDRAFAREFFAKYIEGRGVADYERLLGRAGLMLRKRNAGRAWLGDVRFDTRNGVRVSSLVAPSWPVYAAGLEQDDEVTEIDGRPIHSETDAAAALQRRKPGDRAEIAFIDRARVTHRSTVTLAEDPHLEAIPIESAGGTLTPAQRTFRDRWLKPT
jgi:predicted metalloprotease with PDZ domain